MLAAQSLSMVLLGALTAFQIKHFACDFALQTQRQIQAKGNYGQLAGMEHSGLHAIASLPALLILSNSPITIAIVMISEFLVHYHVDWSKARIDKTYRWSDTSAPYWIVFGLDQLIHQMTYLVIVFVLIPPA
jgi:ascorbate-specific PTS system EIIC-type component UlaA